MPRKAAATTAAKSRGTAARAAAKKALKDSKDEDMPLIPSSMPLSPSNNSNILHLAVAVPSSRDPSSPLRDSEKAAKTTGGAQKKAATTKATSKSKSKGSQTVVALSRGGSPDALDLLSSDASKSKSARTHTRVWDSSDEELEAEEGSGLPAGQIQAILANYDLEGELRASKKVCCILYDTYLTSSTSRLAAEARLERMRSALEMALQTARERMALSISRIPRAVRELSVRSFVEDFQADVAVFMKTVLGSADQEYTRETEQLNSIKEGRKRSSEDGLAKSPGKKHTRSTAPTSDPQGKGKAKPAYAKNTSQGHSKPPAGTGGNSAANLRSSIFNSTISAFPAASSSSPAPRSNAMSSSKFHSRLDAGSRRMVDAGLSFAPAAGSSSFGGGAVGGSSTPSSALARGLMTPGGRPRAARTGEHVQWMSLNGSPLTGVIGPDGRVRQLDQASSSRGMFTSSERNLDELEEDRFDAVLSSSFLTSMQHLPRNSLGLPGVAGGSSSTGKGTEKGRTAPSATASNAAATAITSEAFDPEDSLVDDLPDEAAYTAQGGTAIAALAAATTAHAQQQR
ncbi:hypothetical protein K437DRAFT_261844 [Tilletiaria anomala UBC 951]|uniref:Borealin N-terminal domain-containing protein n=1 Tax=Tilletiaria anomala (strain ATCC 24038 / CBS 436.72 / UBC 951) TaxID=1037660 RepID=A0A066WK32_TILAU|nr:uncharacterized protein K437DRAFT_261844 [Tilletiaria anomala UBC 951]KDN51364.1 hypothetical protein K437DRAFT_261844 [Tilletiaria anomala UBC 951]